MINLNGILIDESKEIFNTDNRAFKYGDALFETLKVTNLKINFLEDHYFRLMASMRMLRMKIPMNFTLEYLENEILKTVLKNGFRNARVRLNIYRKNGGLYLPETNEIAYLIEVSALEVTQKESYVVDLFKDYFVYSGLLSSIKTTSKLINVLAGIYASENGYDNCILLNEKKNIVEAINGNIFIVKGNTIKTPSITEGCIRGIIRKKLIGIISENKEYVLQETEISPFEFQKCDEIFLTNAIVGIQPITSYKKMEYSTKVSKELLLALNKLI